MHTYLRTYIHTLTYIFQACIDASVRRMPKRVLATGLERCVKDPIAESELVVACQVGIRFVRNFDPGLGFWPGRMACVMGRDHHAELHNAPGRVCPLRCRWHQVLLVLKAEGLGMALYRITTEAMRLWSQVRRPNVVAQLGDVVWTVGVQAMRAVFCPCLRPHKVSARRICQVSVALYHTKDIADQGQEDDPPANQTHRLYGAEAEEQSQMASAAPCFKRSRAGRVVL